MAQTITQAVISPANQDALRLVENIKTSALTAQEEFRRVCKELERLQNETMEAFQQREDVKALIERRHVLSMGMDFFR